MGEYIERKALDKALTAAAINDENKNCNTWSNAIGVLYTLPAADVAPVVHGRWKLLHKGDWTSVFVCSVCGRRETITESESYNSRIKMPRKYPYCHCGARMDGEAE